MSEERAYGWDDTVDSPNEGPSYATLVEGDYPFKVIAFKRARHEPKGDGKLPACNKAVLTIEIDGGDQGTARVDHNLFLHSRCEGFLCAFFASIGLRKHGEPLRMDWGKVTGATGRCRVAQVPGKQQGVVFNEIKRFLDPVNGQVPATAAAATPEFKW